MKQCICPKAGEYSDANCDSAIPHNFDYCCKTKCLLGSVDEIGVKCIRYRHPLEVAILREIAQFRRWQKRVKYCGTNWYEYRSAIVALWRVLKSGMAGK